jgi:hypothetical protein
MFYNSTLSPRLIPVLLLTCCLAFQARATAIDDSLLHRVARRFVEQQKYKLEKIVLAPTAPKNGFPPEYRSGCYGGKEMLVIAVYEKEPKKPSGRMLVAKKQNGNVKFDEHPFQPVAIQYEFEIYCSLLQVLFPGAANYLNCEVNLQVFDKANPKNRVWLIILTR